MKTENPTLNRYEKLVPILVACIDAAVEVYNQNKDKSEPTSSLYMLYKNDDVCVCLYLGKSVHGRQSGPVVEVTIDKDFNNFEKNFVEMTVSMAHELIHWLQYREYSPQQHVKKEVTEFDPSIVSRGAYEKARFPYPERRGEIESYMFSIPLALLCLFIRQKQKVENIDFNSFQYYFYYCARPIGFAERTYRKIIGNMVPLYKEMIRIFCKITGQKEPKMDEKFTVSHQDVEKLFERNRRNRESKKYFNNPSQEKENPMRRNPYVRSNPMTLSAVGTDDRPDANYDPMQLYKGVHAELNDKHSPRIDIAKKIAKDHLDEDRKYYTKLEAIEKPYFPEPTKTKSFYQKGIPEFKNNPVIDQVIDTVQNYIKSTFTNAVAVPMSSYGRAFHVGEQWRYVAAQVAKQFKSVRQYVGAIKDGEYHVAKIGPKIIVHLRVHRDLTVAVYNPEAAKDQLGDEAPAIGTIVALMPLNDSDWIQAAEHFDRAEFTSIEANPKVKNPRQSTTIQTLIFSKKHFTKKQAQAWAKEHGYNTKGVDEKKLSYRIRQIDPKTMKKSSFRTIEITKGIKAVVGKELKKKNPIPRPGTKEHEEYQQEQIEEMRFIARENLDSLPASEANEKLRKFREMRAAAKGRTQPPVAIPMPTPSSVAPSVSTPVVSDDHYKHYVYNYDMFDSSGNLIDNDSRITALATFINKMCEHAQDEDYILGSGYDEIILENFFIGNIQDPDLKEIVCDLNSKGRVPKDKIKEWIVDNHRTYLGNMHIPNNAVEGMSLGETEFYLTDFHGTVNGVKTDDVFKTIMDDIPDSEKLEVIRRLDCYWVAHRQYVLIDQTQDYVWVIVDNPKKMRDELMTDDHIEKVFGDLLYATTRYKLKSGGRRTPELDTVEGMLNEFQDYVIDLKDDGDFWIDPRMKTIGDIVIDNANDDERAGKPMPKLFQRSQNPLVFRKEFDRELP